MGVVKVVNMWPDAHQHMCMNEDGKSGVGSSRVGAYSMFGQFNDLPRSEARDRASEVSKDTEGGAAASICASEAAAPPCTMMVGGSQIMGVSEDK